MLKNIPTHVIAGPLGAGKTTLIRELLRHKPRHERWAVLINEFGQVGLDAALLSREDAADGVTLAEVAGGCLCCVNGAPFQVGLGRLLRASRPDRLLIEPSGLGHPRELLAQLRAAPWTGVLAVQAPVLVLDAAALAAGNELAASQGDVLDDAGLVVMNKSEGLDEYARRRILCRMPAKAMCWTSHAHLAFTDLPGHDQMADSTGDADNLPAGAPPISSLWLDAGVPQCEVQDQPEGWSIGWRWHPSQRFERLAVQRWLDALPWRRAKLVLHDERGWCSLNALRGQPAEWRISEWRKDSRLELIFDDTQDRDRLSEALQACRVR